MRRSLIWITLFMAMLSAFFARADTEFTVAAKGAVLIEAESGRILFEQNANEMLPMASTTKIMTCLLALENSSLDETVTASANAHGVTGTSIYLSEGESLTMEQMLYGLMLRSGNDAAVAIAEHISGSTENFAELMNARAKELGADAQFVNPHGLDAQGHKASALGMALIMREALKNPDFARISSTKEKIIPWEGNEYSRLLQNKNKLLTSYEGAMSGKTGYTSKAGRCLVFSAQRDGMTLIGCVLNCSTWFDTATAMLDYGFEHYSNVDIGSAGSAAAEIQIHGGTEDKVQVLFDGNFKFPVATDEQYEITLEIPESADAPIYSGDTAGYAVAKKGDTQICRIALIYSKDVPENDFEYAIGKVIDSWFLVLR